MSMIGNYLRITEVQLSRLLEDPSTIVDVLYPDDGQGDHAPTRHLDIEKSWHAIQFLLTGDPWSGEPPLQNAVMGGRELGEEDVGYGPARYLSAAEVAAVAAALAGISGEELWSRFDEGGFARAEIYPQRWSYDGKEYVLAHYEALREFFKDAAAAQDAMLLYLN
jgi:uncharacterized protein DUF1877